MAGDAYLALSAAADAAMGAAPLAGPNGTHADKMRILWAMDAAGIRDITPTEQGSRMFVFNLQNYAACCTIYALLFFFN